MKPRRLVANEPDGRTATRTQDEQTGSPRAEKDAQAGEASPDQ